MFHEQFQYTCTTADLPSSWCKGLLTELINDEDTSMNIFQAGRAAASMVYKHCKCYVFCGIVVKTSEVHQIEQIQMGRMGRVGQLVHRLGGADGHLILRLEGTPRVALPDSLVNAVKHLSCGGLMVTPRSIRCLRAWDMPHLESLDFINIMPLDDSHYKMYVDCYKPGRACQQALHLTFCSLCVDKMWDISASVTEGQHPAQEKMHAENAMAFLARAFGGSAHHVDIDVAPGYHLPNIVNSQTCPRLQWLESPFLDCGELAAIMSTTPVAKISSLNISKVPTAVTFSRPLAELDVACSSDEDLVWLLDRLVVNKLVYRHTEMRLSDPDSSDRLQTEDALLQHLKSYADVTIEPEDIIEYTVPPRCASYLYNMSLYKSPELMSFIISNISQSNTALMISDDAALLSRCKLEQPTNITTIVISDFMGFHKPDLTAFNTTAEIRSRLKEIVDETIKTQKQLSDMFPCLQYLVLDLVSLPWMWWARLLSALGRHAAAQPKIVILEAEVELSDASQQDDGDFDIIQDLAKSANIDVVVVAQKKVYEDDSDDEEGEQ